MNYLTLLSGLFGGSSASGANGQKGSSAMSLIMIVALFALMYFFMIRPQKKKQKEEQNMRDSIQIGDEITTIGGIMGRVVTVKDDSIVLETGAGAERTKMKFQRWAIQTNETANARMEEEKKAAEEAKKKKSEQDAIDAAVNGKSPKKTKRVKNKGTVEELKAEETAEKASEETETEKE